MILIFLLVSVYLVSCSASTKLNPEISDNERMFRSKCISCHSLPDVKSRTDEQWIKLIEEHKSRVKISQNTISLILNFLQNNN
jgi:hypothetical protein